MYDDAVTMFGTNVREFIDTPAGEPRASNATHWTRVLHQDAFDAGARDADAERVELRAADGYPLSAAYFAPAQRTRAQLVVAGAVGVPQRFYRRFAQFAASAGYATLTFDYRGIGRSAPRSLEGFRMDYFDWGRLDLAAAVDAMSRPGVPLYVVGHSFGGHALGQLPQHDRVAGMVTFGTGAGWHGWMSPLERLKVLAMWHVVAPLLIRWKGYLAWSMLGMGEDVPLDFYRAWKRWCRQPRYFFDDPSARRVARHYARVRMPLMAVNATDDRWSPPESRDAFMTGYRNAARESLDVDPAHYGLPAIGHLGYFRRDATRLWEFALAWVDRVSSRRSARPGAERTLAPWRTAPGGAAGAA